MDDFGGASGDLVSDSAGSALPTLTPCLMMVLQYCTLEWLANEGCRTHHHHHHQERERERESMEREERVEESVRMNERARGGVGAIPHHTRATRGTARGQWCGAVPTRIESQRVEEAASSTSRQSKGTTRTATTLLKDT